MEFELEEEVVIKENPISPDNDICDESWDISTIQGKEERIESLILDDVKDIGEIINKSETRRNDKTCKYCGKLFPRKYFLNDHVLYHLNKNEFKCSECEKSFNTKVALQNHIVGHKNERKFKC